MENIPVQCLISEESHLQNENNEITTIKVKEDWESENNTIIDEEKSFSCTKCDFSCSSKDSLKEHMLTHKNEKTFKCSQCDFKTRAKRYLTQHKKSHTKRFPCPVCNVLFASSRKVERHMSKHMGVKSFKCNLCGFSSFRRGCLKKHMITHKTVNSISCSECEYTCAEYKALIAHMSKHTGVEPKERKRKKEKKNMYMYSQSGERPYASTLGNYTGVFESNLRTQVLTHTKSVKSIACQECDYTCSTSKDLIAHMSKHTGIKAFACSICEKRFTTVKGRNKHLMIHTGEKPYKCSFCGYQCRTLDRLNSHERVHTGEKPHSCLLCSFCCNDSGNLSKHIKNKHSGDEKEPTRESLEKKLTSKDITKETQVAKKIYVPDIKIKESIKKLIGKASPKLQKILQITLNSIESVDSGGILSNPDAIDNCLDYQMEILQVEKTADKNNLSRNTKNNSDITSLKKTDISCKTSMIVENKIDSYKNVNTLVKKSTQFLSGEPSPSLPTNSASLRNIENTQHSPISPNHSPSAANISNQFRNSFTLPHAPGSNNSQTYNQTSFHPHPSYFNPLFNNQHIYSAVNRNLINQNSFLPNSPQYNSVTYNNHEPSFTNQSE